MNQLYNNKQYKIIALELPAGKLMPRHYATSDAFIIVIYGLASLIMGNQTVELKQGSTFLIPANQAHILEIIENFKANIVMASHAEIKFFETN